MKTQVIDRDTANLNGFTVTRKQMQALLTEMDTKPEPPKPDDFKISSIDSAPSDERCIRFSIHRDMSGWAASFNEKNIEYNGSGFFTKSLHFVLRKEYAKKLYEFLGQELAKYNYPSGSSSSKKYAIEIFDNIKQDWKRSLHDLTIGEFVSYESAYRAISNASKITHQNYRVVELDKLSEFPKVPWVSQPQTYVIEYFSPVHCKWYRSTNPSVKRFYSSLTEALDASEKQGINCGSLKYRVTVETNRKDT